MQNGTTWTLIAPTVGLAGGTYTYYAIAVGANNVSSNVVSIQLTVTIPKPIIGTVTVSSSSVTAGTPVVLAASNVTETGGSITAVNFYRQTANGGVLVGTAVQNGTTWKLTISTAGLASGTYTYYAIAFDAEKIGSRPVSTQLTITIATTSSKAKVSVKI